MVIFYFPKFYNFFKKRATGGLFDYDCIVPQEVKKGFSSQQVLRHNFLQKMFVNKIFKDQDF